MRDVDSELTHETIKFIRAFIARERRPRYLSLGDLPSVYHKLEAELDPKCMLELPHRLYDGRAIVDLVGKLSSADSGFVLFSEGFQEDWMDKRTALEAFAADENADWYDESIVVSFEPGRLAYFAPEAYYANARYLLVKGDKLRERARAVLLKVTEGRPAKKRRSRRGSRR